MIRPSDATLRTLVGAVAQLEAEGTPATSAEVRTDVSRLGGAYIQNALVVAVQRGLLVGGRGARSQGYRVTEAGRAFLRVPA